MTSSINDAIKVVDECQADGKTFYTDDQKNKKIGEMTSIFFDEKLKLLKAHLFKEYIFVIVTIFYFRMDLIVDFSNMSSQEKFDFLKDIFERHRRLAEFNLSKWMLILFLQ